MRRQYSICTKLGFLGGGGEVKSCVLFAEISQSSPLWTGHKFSLRLNLSSLVNVFNQEKKNCLLVNKNYITMDFFLV